MMERIFLPPGPMRSRILSVGICSLKRRGAYADISARAFAQRLVHDVQNLQARLPRLRQRFAHHGDADAARP